MQNPERNISAKERLLFSCERFPNPVCFNYRMVFGAELTNNPMRLAAPERRGIQIEGSSKFEGGMEAKSGKLRLCLSSDQSNQAQKVILKVYAAVPCPFAVVFPDKFVCPKHCGLLQLKNFSVESRNDTDFTVVIKNNMEGVKYLTFTAESSAEKDSWLNVFQSLSTSCASKCKTRLSKNIRLPSLEEVSEEVERLEESTILKSCENVLRENVDRGSPKGLRRRVLEAPCLEQISEEEGEDELEDEEMGFENRVMSSSASSRRRSSLKDCLVEVAVRGGRSL